MMGADFDNPSVIRTVITSEGRKGYRIEVRRGRDVLLSVHPKLVKSFPAAFSIGDRMQTEARKAFAI